MQEGIPNLSSDLKKRLASAFNRNDLEDAHWELPERLGVGQLSMLNIEPGLVALSVNAHFIGKQVLSLEDIVSIECFLLYFDLSSNSTRYVNKDNISQLLLFDHRSSSLAKKHSKGTTFLGSLNLPVTMEFPSTGQYSGLFIFVSSEWVNAHIEISALNSEKSVISIMAKTKSYLLKQNTVEQGALAYGIVRRSFPSYLWLIAMKVDILKLITTTLIDIMGDDSNSTGVMAEDFGRILDTRDYMLKSFDEKPPKIEDLARYATMGTTKFKTLFKTVFGVSVYQFYQRQRIYAAKDLLATGRYSVAEVAYEVGYHNHGYFAKVFKEYCNMMPKEYLLKKANKNTTLVLSSMALMLTIYDFCFELNFFGLQ